MRDTVSFTVPGAPRGKGRPRIARRGDFVRAYTDDKTAAYENLVAMSASTAHRGRPPMDGPLKVTALFYMPRPKSAPKRVILPATKPDLDNMVKAVLDGCNQAGIWADDSRVVCLHAVKMYGNPRCEVAIESMEPPNGEPSI